MNLITPEQAEAMNRSIVWSELSREDRRKVRREMIVQAEKLLRAQFPVVAQRLAAARTMVDQAISQESKRVKAWQN